MRYNSIQTLRCVAVLLVVLLHSGNIVQPALVQIPFVSRFGWIGVDLFFVLSGFIIAETIPNSSDFPQYLRRRYMRVFPLYGLFTLMALLLQPGLGIEGMVLPRTDSHAPFTGEGPVWWVASALIVPQDNWPVFGVGWSLEFEVVFYAVFGFAWFFGSPAIALGVVAVLAMAGLLGIEPMDWMVGRSFAFFLAGIVAQRAVGSSNHDLRVGLMGLALPATLLWPLARYEILVLSEPTIHALTAVSLGGLVCLAASLERSGRAFGRPTIVTRIGDASFALYLTHWLILQGARTALIAHSFGPVQAELLRAVLVLGSIAVASAVHHGIERRLDRLLRRRSGRHYASSSASQ